MRGKLVTDLEKALMTYGAIQWAMTCISGPQSKEFTCLWHQRNSITAYLKQQKPEEILALSQRDLYKLL